MPQQGHCLAEPCALTLGERVECVGESFYSPLAAFPHQTDAFGRSFEPNAAAIFGGVAADEARAFQASDDAAHGGRADLLGIGKFAEGFWPAKNEHRKRGKLRRADPGFAVADAQPA